MRRKPSLEADNARVRQIQKQRSIWMQGFHKAKKENQTPAAVEKVEEPEAPRPVSSSATRPNAAASNNNNGALNSFAHALVDQKCCICYELMIPPTRCPILLFPCGHTFCALCLDQCPDAVLCPYCRTEIVSRAVNQSLKQIMEQYSSRLPAEAVQSAVSTATDENEEAVDPEMIALRRNILTVEQKKLAQEIAELEHTKERHQRVEQELKRQKHALLQQVDALDDRIQQEQRQQAKTFQAQKKLESKIDLIQSTIDSLGGN